MKNFLPILIFITIMFIGCQEQDSNDNQTKTANIPQDCVSWFDGCNTCTANNGILGACTRKYCPPEATEEPRCLKYAE